MTRWAYPLLAPQMLEIIIKARAVSWHQGSNLDVLDMHIAAYPLHKYDWCSRI